MGVALVVVAGFPPARVRAEPCAGDATALRVNVVGEGWPARVREEILLELRTILEPRQVRVCSGPRQAGPGAELRREPSGTVRIRVWRQGDPPLTVRPTAGFDPGPLPPDAFSFALARAVDGLLQQAEVVPRPAAERRATPAATPPASAALSRPVPARSGRQTPAAPTPREEFPAWSSRVTLGATARGFSTGDAQFGGLLGFGASREHFGLVAEVQGSGGLARGSALGSVTASLWGGTLAVQWREVFGSWTVAVGPSVSLYASRFSGEANVAAVVTRDAWRPVLLAGARVQADWAAGPAVIWVAFDGSGALVGAEGRDDLAGVSRLTGFTGLLALGVGLGLP